MQLFVKLVLAACSVLPFNALAAPMIFFGEDLGLGEFTRLPAHPNADQARNAFFAQIAAPLTESLESFPAGATAPLNVSLGASGATATLLGTGSILDVPNGTLGVGRYPISGNKFWNSASAFSITFSQPQAAFGFYGVDVGDFAGQLTITYVGGATQVITVPNTQNGPGGGIIYFGVIDTANPFTSVAFGNTSAGSDVFGFDDFTVASPLQVIAPRAELRAIPTMSVWGMLLLTFLVLLSAVHAGRKRRI